MYDGYPAAEYTTERKMEGKIQWRGGPEVEVFWVNMKYVHCSLFTLIASTALYHWSTRLVHELTITGKLCPCFCQRSFCHVPVYISLRIEINSVFF